jgi:HEXXH motif-containing protein
LETAVEAAVGELVLLRARAAFDISHSEPRWPRAIFISVPGRPGPVSALRAVENVIHEAMHLHLTTIERADSLIADETMQMASPWRQEPRHLQGVLHGFYVFRCIAAFFATPTLNSKLDAEGARHVARRRGEIASELSRLDFDRLAVGLTPRGRAFLAALAC